MKILKNYPAKPFAFIYERIAAKTHACNCCRNQILAGSRYFDKKGIRENHSFYNFKYCNSCYSKENI